MFDITVRGFNGLCRIVSNPPVFNSNRLFPLFFLFIIISFLSWASSLVFLFYTVDGHNCWHYFLQKSDNIMDTSKHGYGILIFGFNFNSICIILIYFFFNLTIRIACDSVRFLEFTAVVNGSQLFSFSYGTNALSVCSLSSLFLYFLTDLLVVPQNRITKFIRQFIYTIRMRRNFFILTDLNWD